jgi:hypothetical protein
MGIIRVEKESSYTFILIELYQAKIKIDLLILSIYIYKYNNV